MSCNGCRILRKGCSDDCMLRQCLQCIDNPQAQANATLFVAKFFGRAGLMSFLSSFPPSQRAALFQSLLFEAVGRTINPVSGAAGLLSTGNWHLCQNAVMTVLRGGPLEPLPDSGNLVVLEFDCAPNIYCSNYTRPSENETNTRVLASFRINQGNDAAQCETNNHLGQVGRCLRRSCYPRNPKQPP